MSKQFELMECCKTLDWILHLNNMGLEFGSGLSNWNVGLENRTGKWDWNNVFANVSISNHS